MRKFKCIKSYESGEWLTEGKIYYENNRILRFDNGWETHEFNYESKERFLGEYPISCYLVEIKEEEKKVNKFKVGDIVIGNNSHCYGYTNKGVKCEVTKVFNKEEIKVKIIDGSFDGDVEFTVEPKYFDLFKSYTYNTKTLTITTSDSTTTLSDGTHTTSINRYYTDKHDVKVAVNEVVKKYFDEVEMEEKKNKMPKVGDMVKVVDDERVYSRYDDWMIENKIEYKYALLWQKNYSPENGSTGFIRAIHPHLSYDDRILALVETEYHAYIINIEGLEVIK